MNLYDASTELIKVLRERHYGRMPDEVQRAFDDVVTSLEKRDVQISEMHAQKTHAMRERNQLVVALAKLFPSGKGSTVEADWDKKWQGVVYIDLPTGQVSWHFHEDHAYMLADLPAYTGTWDGHDTVEKYDRLWALSGYVAVSLKPSEGLLASMAMRSDHSFGAPRQVMLGGKLIMGYTPEMRQGMLRNMAQLHEEVVGTGFYRPSKEGYYTQFLTST